MLATTLLDWRNASRPVLPVTDSLLVGQHVDGVLFAILKDVSRAPAVYAAQQKLAPLGVPTLGAVVLGLFGLFSLRTRGDAIGPDETASGTSGEGAPHV